MMCSTLIMKSRALVILGLLVVGTHANLKVQVRRLGQKHLDVLAHPHDTLKFGSFSDLVVIIEGDKEFANLTGKDKMVVRKARKYVDETQDTYFNIAAAGSQMNVALVVMFILCCGLSCKVTPFYSPNLAGSICCLGVILLLVRAFLNYLWVMF
eukprot:202596_1